MADFGYKFLKSIVVLIAYLFLFFIIANTWGQLIMIEE